MNLTLRRTFAASAASLIVLAAAACSDETEGKPTPAGSESTSSTEETGGSESTETSSGGSESTETESGSTETGGSTPAGSQTSSDGAFTFEYPEGYEDATGQVSVPAAVASMYDVNATSGIPTTIVVTKESLQSYSLEEMADAVVGQLEKSLGATATLASNFPLSDVDGENVIAYTTDTYSQGGQDLQSAIALTEHDGEAYGFIVNTAPENVSDAGDKLVELIETVSWS